MKYVWLDIMSGEFSNSWTEEEHSENLREETKDGWKLIKYECLNDRDFSFNLNFKLR